MSPRQEIREHIFYGLTRSTCPVCRRVLDAQVLLRDGRVYLRKHCPEHGWHEALVSSDADWYIRAARYNKPGAVPFHFATAVERGCPEDCGLCPEHQQHTCVGILEITDRCNQDCPTCFADAGSGSGYDLSPEQVVEMLARFVQAEGRPEVLQISGGEPTMHPHLIEILAAAKEHDIRHLMINTNGRRLAQDPDLIQALSPFQPTIYLQFDGLRPSTYKALRGQNLLPVKLQALENLAGSGLSVDLVATVVAGVNEDELGDILRFGLEHPAVHAVSFQPATYAGRNPAHDPLHRSTVTGVLHLLEEQTGGMLRVDDFLPVPCPHPACTACTYLFLDDGQVTPIPRLIEVEDYLDYIANRTAPDLSAEFRPLLESLWSLAAVMGSEQTADDLTCVACGISLPLPEDLRQLEDRFFMVQVHAFMDEHTMDLSRLMKCCVHELLPDGRTVPFCAYNNLGYREEVRRSLAGKEGR